MPLEKLLNHFFYNKFVVQNCSKKVANCILYIRRSSNGLGRGDVQPNVRFKSHLASQSSLTKRTGMLIKNECEHGRLLLRQAESLKGNWILIKNTEKGSFSVCFHLNRFEGEASADKGWVTLCGYVSQQRYSGNRDLGQYPNWWRKRSVKSWRQKRCWFKSSLAHHILNGVDYSTSLIFFI